MTNYYTEPCPDCEGHGFRPDGYFCHGCQGTGREWARGMRIKRPDLGCEETISVKVRCEILQDIEFEQRKRREELGNFPELKARVEAVEAMHREEMEIQRQFEMCEGPHYEKWIAEQREKAQQRIDNEPTWFQELDGEILPHKEGVEKIARKRAAQRMRRAEENTTDPRNDQLGANQD